MPTLQSKKNPGARRDAGDHVLNSAESVDLAPVKKRFATFKAVHGEFTKADDRVAAAEGALRAVQQKVGELDVEQDAAVDALASALVGEGGSRTRPFAPFKLDAPSVLQGKGDVEEAKIIGTLVARVRKTKPGAKVAAACARAQKAADAVLAAAKPLDGLVKARHGAIVARDAIGVRWEKAFHALKNGARAAEDDGATGLFDALFGGAAPARPSHTRAKAPPKPAPKTAPGDATPPAASKTA